MSAIPEALMERLHEATERFHRAWMTAEHVDQTEEAVGAAGFLEAQRNVSMVHPWGRNVLPQPVENQDAQREKYLLEKVGCFEHPGKDGQHSLSHFPCARRLIHVRADSRISTTSVCRVGATSTLKYPLLTAR